MPSVAARLDGLDAAGEGCGQGVLPTVPRKPAINPSLEVLALSNQHNVDVGHSVRLRGQGVGVTRGAAEDVGSVVVSMTWFGFDQSLVVEALPTPPEPSVTSASWRPWLCTFRYASALFLNSFDRPGPKSVKPGDELRGVVVVVWWKRIVVIGQSSQLVFRVVSVRAVRQRAVSTSVYSTMSASLSSRIPANGSRAGSH